MLKITIELIPRGRGKPIHIATGTIVNDGTGTKTKGNYQIYLSKCSRKNHNVVWKQGEVQDFPRKTKNAWNLLYLGLKNIIGG